MALEQNAVGIDLTGYRNVLTAEQRVRVQRALRRIGMNVKGQMRRRCRVRTGRLRSSIYTRGIGLRQYVGFNEVTAPYARFVEFGTYRMAGDFIMDRSIRAEMGRTRRLLSEAIGDVR